MQVFKGSLEGAWARSGSDTWPVMAVDVQRTSPEPCGTQTQQTPTVSRPRHLESLRHSPGSCPAHHRGPRGVGERPLVLWGWEVVSPAGDLLLSLSLSSSFLLAAPEDKGIQSL